MVLPRRPAALDPPPGAEGHPARSPGARYELRYLEHDARYTDTDWGFDYDYVLDDLTTRVKRVFVSTADAIELAIAPWLTDLTQLRPPGQFDSALVNSPIDVYLDRPEERPHLWL
jgi:hypothetical protein